MPTAVQLYREHVKEKLETIQTAVELTNGRVQSLERWRAFMTGGLGVLTLIVVPIALFIITRVWLK